MIVSLIVAMDENRAIGKDGKLPWHLPSDLKRFKALTMSHHIVMGRKTYETIGKPLPGRKMIIVTHRKTYSAPDCMIVNSIETAIEIAKNNRDPEVFIIGGGEIFRQAFGYADKIYLTYVHANIKGDVFFPELDQGDWETIYSESRTNSEFDDYLSDFKILQRMH